MEQCDAGSFGEKFEICIQFRGFPHHMSELEGILEGLSHEIKLIFDYS